MSIEREVRDQLENLGIETDKKNQIQTLGLELTVCQFIVVVMSFFSLAFLFVPLFFLRNLFFMFGFFTVSLACMGFGIWFWLNKADICEHPEEYV